MSGNKLRVSNCVCVHLRKVLSQGADEMSSKDTPEWEAATLPGNHDDAAVRWPAD